MVWVGMTMVGVGLAAFLARRELVGAILGVFLMFNGTGLVLFELTSTKERHFGSTSFMIAFLVLYWLLGMTLVLRLDLLRKNRSLDDLRDLRS